MQAELATDAAPALVKGTASLKLTIVLRQSGIVETEA